MKKSRLSRAVCAAALVILSNTAHAALVNQISGLDIGGTLYDVTFHNTTGDTFRALWDADNDGVFGGGASVFTAAPTFWGDDMGALTAVNAIIAALGPADTTSPSRGRDSFSVPYGTAITSDITSGDDFISVYRDANGAPTIETIDTVAYGELQDISQTFPYVSFEVSAVPVPAAVWLFGSGLLGLVGVARRKKA